jgi:hypothetical protein
MFQPPNPRPSQFQIIGAIPWPTLLIRQCRALRDEGVILRCLAGLVLCAALLFVFPQLATLLPSLLMK